jgi:hypothetical protein
MKLPAIILVIVASLAACGCSTSEKRYAGDGRLHDAGPFTLVDRYVVELGPVELRNAGRATFQLANLPQVPLTVGLDITFAQTQRAIELMGTRPIYAVVDFTLYRADGTAVFHDEASLYQDAAWWANEPDTTRAFVYSLRRRTTFVPDPDRAYLLAVTVTQPDRGSAVYVAAAAVRGGGWQGRD